MRTEPAAMHPGERGRRRLRRHWGLSHHPGLLTIISKGACMDGQEGAAALVRLSLAWKRLCAALSGF